MGGLRGIRVFEKCAQCRKNININKDNNNNNEFEIVQRAPFFFFFGKRILNLNANGFRNGFNSYELHPQEQVLLAVSLLVFWINEKSMAIISAGTGSTHQWIYKWVNYSSSLCVCVNTVKISCSTAEHHEVLSNFHSDWLLALTQAEDDERMALVRSCKTIQGCHLDEFLNSSHVSCCWLSLVSQLSSKKAKWPMIEGLSCGIP